MLCNRNSTKSISFALPLTGIWCERREAGGERVGEWRVREESSAESPGKQALLANTPGSYTLSFLSEEQTGSVFK